MKMKEMTSSGRSLPVVTEEERKQWLEEARELNAAGIVFCADMQSGETYPMFADKPSEVKPLEAQMWAERGQLVLSRLTLRQRKSRSTESVPATQP
jgi:hypothetical protein